MTTSEIEQTQKLIEDKTAAIEATFKAELGNPIDCGPYKKKGSLRRRRRSPPRLRQAQVTATPSRPIRPPADVISENRHA